MVLCAFGRIGLLRGVARTATGGPPATVRRFVDCQMPARAEVPEPDRGLQPARVARIRRCITPLVGQQGRANWALLLNMTLALAGILAAVALYLNPVRSGPYAPHADSERLSGPAVRKTAGLRLVGSNTIGSALAPALAKAYLEQRLGAVRVKLDQAPGQHQQWIEGVVPGDPMRPRIVVVATGSGFAFEALVRGDADIGMSSRAVAPSEQHALAQPGKLRGGMREHVLALDGIAVIVNPGNPIDTLSMDQLRRIFSGSVRIWAEVGGSKLPVRRYARNRESGTFASFLALTSLNGGRLARDTRYMTESRELSDAVANDPNGIGFVARSQIGAAKAVRVAAANGFALSATQREPGADDDPLTRRLYLYAPANSSNPLVADFLDFVLSPAGQAVIEGLGFLVRVPESEAGSAGPSLQPEEVPTRSPQPFGTADADSSAMRLQSDRVPPDR